MSGLRLGIMRGGEFMLLSILCFVKSGLEGLGSDFDHGSEKFFLMEVR